MNIKTIGRYTIMSDVYWKQIYSRNGRMLQINRTLHGDKLSYVDTHNMRTLKEFVTKIVQVKDYGSLLVSKTKSRGSTPRTCDLKV